MSAITVNIGQRFGKWKVKAVANAIESKKRWLCECDCGVIREVFEYNLKSGKSTGCGCTRSKLDMIGKRFGKWVVIAASEERIDGCLAWKCKCDCGEVRLVNGSNLRRGASKGCGCRTEKYRYGKGAAKNLIAQRFGKLTVIERVGSDKHGKSLWLCKCECGKEVNRSSSSLNKGSISCGCLKKTRPKPDLKGQRFGYLTAVKKVGTDSKGRCLWECRCDCGNKTIKARPLLSAGKTRSCGCLVGTNTRSRRRDLTGETFGKWRVLHKGQGEGEAFKWVCKCECGTIREVRHRSLSRGRTLSCGCLQRENLKKRMTGENNHNFRHDLSNREREMGRLMYGEMNVKKWRKKVFERDNYICKVCGYDGAGLNAHHLDGWNWAVSKRLDVSNGVTLCIPCHSDFHAKYGKGDNTSNQFEEFINAG